MRLQKRLAANATPVAGNDAACLVGVVRRRLVSISLRLRLGESARLNRLIPVPSRPGVYLTSEAALIGAELVAARLHKIFYSTI